MKRRNAARAAAIILVFSLTACAQPGADITANAYSSGQVNTRQQAEFVHILLVTPAKVKVSNAENQREAQIVGGLLGAMAGAGIGAGFGHHYTLASGTVGAIGGSAFGAAAGSLVPGEVLVDGVSITYYTDNQDNTFNSVQVGRLCEYAKGVATMVATSPGETRIQPNAACPNKA